MADHKTNLAKAKIPAKAAAPAPKKQDAPAKAPAAAAPVAAKPVPAQPAPAKAAIPAVAAKVEGPAAAKVAAAPARPAAKLEPKIIPTINPSESGAKIMNETIQKTQEATKQVAEKATEQFRGAMNETNERSKVAMEKGARFVEEMADLTRGNLEAMVASQKTAAKYAETLSQGAADYSRRSFEEASTALKSFAEVKSPTDFFRLQSEFARSAFDQFVAEGSRVTETVVKMSNDVAEPLAGRYTVAADRLKAVAA
jgi:phasin family protein